MNARLSLIKQRHKALGLAGLRGAALRRKSKELRIRRCNEQKLGGQTTVSTQSTRAGTTSGGHVLLRSRQDAGCASMDRMVLGQERGIDRPAKSPEARVRKKGGGAAASSTGASSANPGSPTSKREGAGNCGLPRCVTAGSLLRMGALDIGAGNGRQEKEGKTTIATQGQGDRTAAHRLVSSSGREGTMCAKGNGCKLGGSCSKDRGVRQECQALSFVETGNPDAPTGNDCAGSGGGTRNLNPSRQNLGAEHWTVLEASSATPPKSSPGSRSAHSRGACIRDRRSPGGFQGQHLPLAGALAKGGQTCTIGQTRGNVPAYAVQKVEHSDHKCPDVASAQPTPGAGAGSASIGKDIGRCCRGAWLASGDRPDLGQVSGESKKGAAGAGCKAEGLWTPHNATGRGAARYRSLAAGRNASTDRYKPWDKPPNCTRNKKTLAPRRELNSCFFVIDKAGPLGRMVFTHGLSMGRRRK